jgi:hypothetical protein
LDQSLGGIAEKSQLAAAISLYFFPIIEALDPSWLLWKMKRAGEFQPVIGRLPSSKILSYCVRSEFQDLKAGWSSGAPTWRNWQTR